VRIVFEKALLDVWGREATLVASTEPVVSVIRDPGVDGVPEGAGNDEKEGKKSPATR
jgi:hypothetical protein